MAIMKQDFHATPENLGLYIAGMSAGSAIMRAAKQIRINGDGAFMTTIGRTAAEWVVEGEAKPVKQSELSTVEIVPAKLAAMQVISEEVRQDEESILAKIGEILTESIPLALDTTVFNGSAPAGISSLSTAGNTAITDYPTFIRATQGSAIKKQIILNQALLAEFLAFQNAFGTPLFTVTDTTINGVPYFLTEAGTGAAGFVGPFQDKSVWGINKNSVQLRFDASASYTVGGVTKSAFQHNEIIALAEARIAFKIYPDALSEFKKLTVSQPAPKVD